MTSGVTANTGSPKRGAKPNGRIPDDNNTTPAKTLTTSNSMDNLLSQFMGLSGQQLRAVFDRAIADHNALVEQERDNYNEEIGSINDDIDAAQAEIEKHTQTIADLNNHIKKSYEFRQERQQSYNTNIENLDQRRALIENMMGLFKHKLDGFTD